MIVTEEVSSATVVKYYGPIKKVDFQSGLELDRKSAAEFAKKQLKGESYENCTTIGEVCVNGEVVMRNVEISSITEK